MLTEQEKEWLTMRKLWRYAICHYCPALQYKEDIHDCCYSCCHQGDGSKPLCYKLRRASGGWDAAEFEARVAARLAELFSASTELAPLCPSCPCEDDCYTGFFKCESAILKYARLAVEEEMNAPVLHSN